jgi:hypothetical protein
MSGILSNRQKQEAANLRGEPLAWKLPMVLESAIG